MKQIINELKKSTKENVNKHSFRLIYLIKIIHQNEECIYRFYIHVWLLKQILKLIYGPTLLLLNIKCSIKVVLGLCIKALYHRNLKYLKINYLWKAAKGRIFFYEWFVKILNFSQCVKVEYRWKFWLGIFTCKFYSLYLLLLPLMMIL